MDVNIFFCFFFDFVSIYFGGGEIYILIFFFKIFYWMKFVLEWRVYPKPSFFFGWIALG